MQDDSTPGPHVLKRFWDKVDKSGGDAACWNWTACSNQAGYGFFRWRKRNAFAHRTAWEFTNGPIPDGLWVLHRCDNPSCVNPRHLFLGTPKDNQQDMIAKGRKVSPNIGEAAHNAKLTEELVKELRERAKIEPRGFCVRASKELGINYATIRDAVVGTTWRHIKSPK